MAKRLREYEIYVAPQIGGFRSADGSTQVYDEKNYELLNPYSLDDKIKIYERQVKDWFLNRAVELRRERNSGFVILMICISYIEGVQQYIEGKESHKESRTMFKKGLRRIFDLSLESETRLNDFYSHARCGLFHNGMSGSQVLISEDYEATIDFSEQETIKINTGMMLDTICRDFDNYLIKLKDPNQKKIRSNFDRLFSVS